MSESMESNADDTIDVNAFLQLKIYLMPNETERFEKHMIDITNLIKCIKYIGLT